MRGGTDSIVSCMIANSHAMPDPNRDNEEKKNMKKKNGKETSHLDYAPRRTDTVIGTLAKCTPAESRKLALVRRDDARTGG